MMIQEIILAIIVPWQQSKKFLFELQFATNAGEASNSLVFMDEKEGIAYPLSSQHFGVIEDCGETGFKRLEIPLPPKSPDKENTG